MPCAHSTTSSATGLLRDLSRWEAKPHVVDSIHAGSALQVEPLRGRSPGGERRARNSCRARIDRRVECASLTVIAERNVDVADCRLPERGRCRPCAKSWTSCGGVVVEPIVGQVARQLADGIVSRKVAPRPGPVDRAMMSPPWVRAMLRAIVNPIPRHATRVVGLVGSVLCAR